MPLLLPRPHLVFILVMSKAETKYSKKTLNRTLVSPLQSFKSWWNMQDLGAWALAIKMAHVGKASTLAEDFRDLESWWRVAVKFPTHECTSLQVTHPRACGQAAAQEGHPGAAAWGSPHNPNSFHHICYFNSFWAGCSAVGSQRLLPGVALQPSITCILDPAEIHQHLFITFTSTAAD